MKLLRPISVTFGTLILFGVWTWIETSGIEYRPGRAVGGRMTAGWFILGSPFLLGFGLLLSLFFSLIARRTRPVVGWLSLLVVFVPLIVSAYSRTTPLARLGTALGSEPPVGTQIQRVDQYDSFNDGITIAGVCSVSPKFVQSLIATHSLKASDSDGLLKRMLRDEPIPEDAAVLTNDELDLWYDADRSYLYFCRRLGQRRQP